MAPRKKKEPIEKLAEAVKAPKPKKTEKARTPEEQAQWEAACAADPRIQ